SDCMMCKGCLNPALSAMPARRVVTREPRTSRTSVAQTVSTAQRWSQRKLSTVGRAACGLADAKPQAAGTSVCMNRRSLAGACRVKLRLVVLALAFRQGAVFIGTAIEDRDRLEVTVRRRRRGAPFQR